MSILQGATPAQACASALWVPAGQQTARREVCGVLGETVDSQSITRCSETATAVLVSARHPKGSVLSVPEPADAVLEKPFIFGLVHTKVDEQFELPYFTIQYE